MGATCWIQRNRRIASSVLLALQTVSCACCRLLRRVWSLMVFYILRESLNMSFSHRWRNVGFMATYILFNVCVLLYSFYTFFSFNGGRFQCCTSSSICSESGLVIPSALSRIANAARSPRRRTFSYIPWLFLNHSADRRLFALGTSCFLSNFYIILRLSDDLIINIIMIIIDNVIPFMTRPSYYCGWVVAPPVQCRSLGIRVRDIRCQRSHCPTQIKLEVPIEAHWCGAYNILLNNVFPPYTSASYLAKCRNKVCRLYCLHREYHGALYNHAVFFVFIAACARRCHAALSAAWKPGGTRVQRLDEGWRSVHLLIINDSYSNMWTDLRVWNPSPPALQ